MNPTVLLGKPQSIENYDVFNVGELAVYVRKGIEIRNNEIHIFLRKFLWIKDLAVDGISINI